MTAQTAHPLHPPLLAVVGLLLAGLGILGAVPATAVPPGGPSPDTEGTSGTASPRTLRVGDVISFSISGFPGGETVSVKIDDGDFCSAKGVHGACVVHQQKISADGTVKGSFALPADLSPGKHWLRFLASEEILDDEGRYKGVKPYSLKGDTDFEVVTTTTSTSGAGGAGGAGPTGQSGGSGSDDAQASPGVTAAGKAPTSGGPGDASSTSPLTVAVPPGTSRSPESAGRGDSVSDGALATSGTTEDATAVTSSASKERAGFPFVGTVVLALAAAGAVLLSRRRRTT